MACSSLLSSKNPSHWQRTHLKHASQARISSTLLIHRFSRLRIRARISSTNADTRWHESLVTPNCEFSARTAAEFARLAQVDGKTIKTRSLPVLCLSSNLALMTSGLLLPWQDSPTGNVGSEAANPVVSTPRHTLRSSEISKPLSVSLVVTRDASSPSSACIAFWDWRSSAKPVLIFPHNFCTLEFCPFVHDLEVWYFISKFPSPSALGAQELSHTRKSIHAAILLHQNAFTTFFSVEVRPMCGVPSSPQVQYPDFRRVLFWAYLLSR